MKFILLADWPVRGGALLVPSGTVIEWTADADAARIAGVPNAPEYLGVPLPLPMPMNAKALDQQSANTLADWYPRHLHLLHAANGIKPKRSFHV